VSRIAARFAVVLSLAAALCTAAPAAAQLPGVPPLPGLPDLPLPGGLAGNPGTPVQPYGAQDGGGFRDVLPPGTRGRYNGLELAAFLAAGQTVPHCCDQLGMYSDLVYATPGLKDDAISSFFKDSTFGVRPDDAESSYSPRADVTIVRDKGFGVPHVYGKTRDGAMFGLGYVGAEDRLFLMDVLRHSGRGELSSFAGGANQAQDAEQWAVAPYTEADLTRQAQQLPTYLGRQGQIIQRDVDNYVAGINQYIAEAKTDPSRMPGEYTAIGRPQGPDPWKREDLIASAALVGGIFGKGGGMELEWSQVYRALRARLGRRLGPRVFRDFRSAEDPEAPTTVLRRRFPYELTPKRIRKGSVALPDPGTYKPAQFASPVPPAGASASAASAGAPVAPLLGFPFSASNALLVPARSSATGRPLMVAGPQVAYFNPQILMEQDVHAPATADLPGIDARGASFASLNLYVQLGRGRDYAWSATSAGQDIIDTFAVDLCEPGGGKPSVSSTHYRFRGACLPMEVLQKTNTWSPTPGDPTPAGTQTLRAERTKLGIVAARGSVRGTPVAFTKLRSTYFHEVDSAAGFMDFNDPAAVRSAKSFQRAASKIGYTFNWFYTDSHRIAYFNSGANPVRAKRTNPDLPVRARKATEWRGWNPGSWTARFTAASKHPQAVDQRYLISWNNKQAKGYRGPDENVFSSVYRSQLLESRLKDALRGGRKITLAKLIEVMEMAGSGDLRAHAVLPWALKIIGRPADPALRAAVDELRAWLAAGGLRRDVNRDGVYEHSDAIRIMDAWWPLWVRAQFQPRLGKAALDTLLSTVKIDNPPNGNGDHHGSAYQGAWFGYVRKDLRTIMGRHVKGRYARLYCGGGRLERCRRVLRASLKAAAAIPASQVYSGDPVCKKAGRDGDQWCWDSIRFRPVGGATQPLIHWINRPTYQQAVSVQRSVTR
jgi:acyl-homoserine lactone acylase PvdQ